MRFTIAHTAKGRKAHGKIFPHGKGPRAHGKRLNFFRQKSPPGSRRSAHSRSLTHSTRPLRPPLPLLSGAAPSTTPLSSAPCRPLLHGRASVRHAPAAAPRRPPAAPPPPASVRHAPAVRPRCSSAPGLCPPRPGRPPPTSSCSSKFWKVQKNWKPNYITDSMLYK